MFCLLLLLLLLLCRVDEVDEDIEQHTINEPSSTYVDSDFDLRRPEFFVRGGDCMFCYYYCYRIFISPSRFVIIIVFSLTITNNTNITNNNNNNKQ